MAQVGRHRNGLPALLDPVGHRVGGIVVDVERLYGHVAHSEIHVRADRAEKLPRVFPEILHFPDLLKGLLRPVDGDFIFPRKDAEPPHMVGVLVGDADGRKLRRLYAHVTKPLFNPLCADPGVDEDVSGFRPRIDAVPAAPAGNANKSHVLKFPSAALLLSPYRRCCR